MDKLQGILSPDHLEDYRENGYVVIPDLLNRQEIENFVQYQLDPVNKPLEQNLDNHKLDPQWAHLAEHPNVANSAAQILDATPYIVQTMYLAKYPQAESSESVGTAMHQDLHYLPCDPQTLMACWIAMSDTDEENGGLCIVPQSHKNGLHSTHQTIASDQHQTWEKEHALRDREGNEWKELFYSFEIDELDPKEIIPLEIPAGSGVFFDGLTIHGSFANKSSERSRLAFAVHYVKQGTWVYRADVQDTVAVSQFL